MPHVSVHYILLCGQFVLLLTVLLSQCLDGIHSENSTEPPGNTGTSSRSPPFSLEPEDNLTESITPTEASNHSELYEYKPPSPVVLCRYLPEDFIICQDPVDHQGNSTALLELGHGCVKVVQTFLSQLIPSAPD